MMIMDQRNDLFHLPFFPGAHANSQPTNNIWHPSSEQVVCLAQCGRLERLDCGAWSPESYPL